MLHWFHIVHPRWMKNWTVSIELLFPSVLLLQHNGYLEAPRVDWGYQEKKKGKCTLAYRELSAVFQIREGSQVKNPRKLATWPDKINGKLRKPAFKSYLEHWLSGGVGQSIWTLFHLPLPCWRNGTWPITLLSMVLYTRHGTAFRLRSFIRLWGPQFKNWSWCSSI